MLLTIEYTFLKANKQKLFATPFRWIIYYNSPVILEIFIQEYFNEINLLVDSDVTLVTKSQEGNIFDLNKIFRRKIDHPILIENIGIWKNGQLIDNGYEKITYKRRRNLMKTVLKSCIVITNNDSLNHLTDKRDIHIDSIAKVNYVLVEHLADTVNASLQYSIKGTWGYKSNNSWSGMIGELTRNEADIGGTALFLTSDRIGFIDYIAMTTPTRSKFIFRQPKLSYVANVFTLPFDVYVWGCVVGLLFVIAGVLYTVVKWEWKKKDYVEVVVSCR